MKKAAIYARVSSLEQKEKRTIESQVIELRRQVLGHDNILVKEYIDDGFSGAQLDRPAFDELRADLKTELFDIIYFLNADRIARNVTYQNLIISEILKYKKKIIINGKDYVENPENKFTLTVLGAVSELERAKIIERSKRGKQLKIKQGFVMGGTFTYGYDYIPRIGDKPGRLIINEKEAEGVRLAFHEYAKPETSINQVVKILENSGFRTKTGNQIWHRRTLLDVLTNTAYYGEKYYNKQKTIEAHNDSSDYLKTTKKKIVKTDKSEWVPVSVPAIISKELFEKVQKRLAWNKKNYRNPGKPFLLTSMVTCGVCGSNYIGYRRKTRNSYNRNIIYHVSYFQCLRRRLQMKHVKTAELLRCSNKQIKTKFLEDTILDAVQNIILNPEQLKKHVKLLDKDVQHKQVEAEKELQKLENAIKTMEYKKSRVVDLFTEGRLPKPSYITRTQDIEASLIALQQKRVNLIRSMPLIRQPALIEENIRNYCEYLKRKFVECTDFKKLRQFLLEVIDKIVFKFDDILITGFIPVGINPDFYDYCEPRHHLRYL